MVEENRENTQEALEVVRKALKPIVDAKADKIVLGCTHYPFLKEQIAKVVDDETVEVIDPAPAIAKRVESLLEEFHLRAEEGHKPTYDFLSLAGEYYIERLKQRVGLK